MRFILILLCAVYFGTATAQPIVTYVATTVPVPIPDGPFGIATSDMSITDTTAIADVNVILTIMHSFDADINIYLEGPNGDVARLAFGCGNSGDNYIDTHFDDEADEDICDGGAPFTGSYRPDRPLALFDGRSIFGVWTLRVTDNYGGDTGTLQAWAMEVEQVVAANPHDLPVVSLLDVGQNYPNPFNATTVLPLDLGRNSQVTLTISSVSGQVLQRSLLNLSAGRHLLSIDASRWSSGNYFAQVGTELSERTVRMTLLK